MKDPKWIIEIEEHREKRGPELRELIKIERAKNPALVELEKEAFHMSLGCYLDDKLIQKARAFADSHKPRFLFRTSYTENFNNHLENHSYKLLRYLELTEKETNTYGLQIQMWCSCPQNRNNIKLFKCKSAKKIEELIHSIKIREEEKRQFFLDDTVNILYILNRPNSPYEDEYKIFEKLTTI